MRFHHFWHNAKLDANEHANVSVDAKCEQTLTPHPIIPSGPEI